MATLKHVRQIALLVVAWYTCVMAHQRDNCEPGTPCVDLDVLQELTEKVGKDIIAPDGDNILLKKATFDKIRKKKFLHGCVLYKIFDFYQQILRENLNITDNIHINDDTRHHVNLFFMMLQLKDCTFWDQEKCMKLYQEAEQKSMKKGPEAKMKPKEAAIHQIQKLNSAKERIDDESIRVRAIDELKTLNTYIRGRGFRRRIKIE